MLFLVFYLTNKEKSYMNIEMAVSLLLNKLIILNTNIPLNIENIKYICSKGKKNKKVKINNKYALKYSRDIFAS